MSYSTSGLGQARRAAPAARSGGQRSTTMPLKLKALKLAKLRHDYLGALGQVGGAPLGRASSRHAAGGGVSVPASWAIRGVNAARSGSTEAQIHVGSSAGPVVVHALRTIAAAHGGGNVTNDPASSRRSTRVIMPAGLEAYLASLPRVSDPPRPAGSTVTTTTIAQSATSTPSTGVKPGAPGAPPTDTTAEVGTTTTGEQVLLDEGDTRPAWLIPVAVGGGVLLLGGFMFVVMRRRAPVAVAANRKNRRKRRRSR